MSDAPPPKRKRSGPLKKAVTALAVFSALATSSAPLAPSVIGESNAPAVSTLSYQKAWLLDRSRFKIAHWCRGARKTFTVTLDAVTIAFETEAAGKKEDWLIVSRGEAQALEALGFCKQHCLAYSFAADVVTETRDTSDLHPNDPSKVISYKVHSITLPGGSRIIALAANPDTLRGYTANIILDEFAFHADSRKIWVAAFPILRGRLRLFVVSTGQGKGNKFYELMADESGPFSRHYVDIYLAVAAGLPFDIELEKRAMNDEDGWAQEYENKWLDEASAWLDYELINGVEHERAGVRDNYAGGPAYLGEDISAGKGRDLWVLTIGEEVGDVLWERERLEGNRLSFAERDAMVDDAYLFYRVIRHCIDQTGMGEAVVEARKRKYGESRVEGVMFTPANKLNMATLAKQRYQDKRLRIKLGDRALRADLHSLKKANGPTGTPRFVVNDDSGEAGKSHADRAWSQFLMIAAAAGIKVNMEFTQVGSARTTDRSLNGYVDELVTTGGRADVRGY